MIFMYKNRGNLEGKKEATDGIFCLEMVVSAMLLLMWVIINN